MRITDLTIKNNFLVNYNRAKTELNDISNTIATQQKINKPSDSPSEIGAMLKLEEQLQTFDTHKLNIDNGFARMNTVLSSLEGILEVSENIEGELSPLYGDAAAADVLYETLPVAIEDTIDALMDFGNTKVEGKYIFGGTDYAREPFAFNSLDNQYSVQSKSIDSPQNIKVANNISVDLNVDGAELFGSVLKHTGVFDIEDQTGTVFTDTKTIFDADGNEHELVVSYDKISDSEYQMNYSVTDTEGNTLVNKTHDLAYNEATGKLQTIDGQAPARIEVSLPSEKINFYLDPKNISIGRTDTVIASNLNQQADILNVLNSLKQSIAAGKRPTANQMMIVNNFSQVVLDKMTEVGDTYNELEDAETVLERQRLEIQTLASKRNDVDMAEALINLERQQYSLDLSYKISSMLLPKSILDYV